MVSNKAIGKPASLSSRAASGMSASISTAPASLSVASERLHQLRHLSVERLPEVAARHTQAQALQRGHGKHRTAGHHGVEQRAIGDATRHRPCGVARVRDRHDARLRPAQQRRPKPDDAAQRRRDSHRAAGVRADATGHDARAHRSADAAARTARNARAVVRVAHRAERGVVVRDAVGELVQARLAEHDGACVDQLLRDRRVALGNVAAQRRRACRRGDACGVDVVFQRERHAVQRAELGAARAKGVGGLRRGAHLGGVVVDEGVQARMLLGAREQGVGISNGAEFAALQCGGGFGDRQGGDVHVFQSQTCESTPA